MNEFRKATYKERFQGFFWWTPPISLVADIIAIGVFLFSQSMPINDKLLPAVGITSADFVAITGFVTVFAVTGTLYFSYKASNKRQNRWWLICGGFGSIFAVGLYLRLWLGANWLMMVLTVIGAILLLLAYTAIRIFGPNQRTTTYSDAPKRLSADTENRPQLPRTRYPTIQHTERPMPMRQESAYSQQKCALCSGRGKYQLNTVCVACSGQGSVLVYPPPKKCALCRGIGTRNPITREPCSACGGTGWAHSMINGAQR